LAVLASRARTSGRSDWRHADGTGDAAHRPDFFAAVQVITGHAQRARYDDLLAAGNVPYHRRAVAAQELGAIRLPQRFARALVEGHEERILIVVLTEQHAVALKDGRAAGPEIVLERSHGAMPEQFSLAVVAEQAGRAKEADDTVAIGGWRRLGQTADGVDRLQRAGRRLALPQHAAAFAIQGQRQQVLVAHGSQVDAITHHNGRRMAGWQCCFPDDVGVRSNLFGQVFRIGRAAGAIGTTELWPVRGLDGQSEERGDE